MIISRTPYRISFFGGGTDYPAWYNDHGGEVLAATIDKYAYITCRYMPPFFEAKYRIVWSKIEVCRTLQEIVHPAIRGILDYLHIDRGLEIHHQGDLPARSGMGSSSSFTVGLLHALYALQGQMPGERKLAMESIYIEQKVLKELVGSQDQVSAAYGGLNHIIFSPGGEISVRPVTISKERIKELNSSLMLFYTGLIRTAASVAESYVKEVGRKKRQLRVMRDMVDESIAILAGNQGIDAFGDLLHEAWQAKRSLSDIVSNLEIDEMYKAALSAGALGGKLTGAGGGGFLLLFVPPARQEAVKEKLKHLIRVPFEFDFSGSQIIFFDPEQNYIQEEMERASMDSVTFREMDYSSTTQVDKP